MLHEVQLYTQITPMEIDILFQLADCRHPDGYVRCCFGLYYYHLQLNTLWQYLKLLSVYVWLLLLLLLLLLLFISYY